MERNELQPIDHTIAGATAGVVARLLGQPLDVLKIRFQLQNHSAKGGLKYTGIVSATQLIIKEEGITALWKGHVPAQLLSVVYGAVQFSTYEHLKKMLVPKTNEKSSSNISPVLCDFISGGIGGVASSLACQPLDVIRTRFIAQTNTSKVYNGIFDAAKKMYKERGILTFYKGFTPTLALIFPYAGLHFAFYGSFKRTWDQLQLIINANKSNEQLKRVVCGSSSGLCAKVILLPLDFIKKRLQVQGFDGREIKYRGLYHGLRTVISENGVKFLYNGATPSILKAAFTTGISFFTYEETCDWLRKHRNT